MCRQPRPPSAAILGHLSPHYVTICILHSTEDTNHKRKEEHLKKFTIDELHDMMGKHATTRCNTKPQYVEKIIDIGEYDFEGQSGTPPQAQTPITRSQTVARTSPDAVARPPADASR
jgi:hypothetical protein